MHDETVNLISGIDESADHYIDWKDWKDSSFGQFDQLQARYYAAETGIAATAGARVLEIGFGNGSFVGWARSVNAEVFGVELNPTLVARAQVFLDGRHAFNTLEHADLGGIAGSFSHIVAFDVIEHVAQNELPEFLKRLGALLATDGRLIVRFPNGDSPFGRVKQHGDPTHLTTIGREKLRFLAGQAGLEVAELRAPVLPLSGVGLTRAARRGLLVMGRYMVEQILGFLYFGGSVIPLDPNYVAVIVRGRSAHRNL